MTEAQFLQLALRLARRGAGTTSPNPMVGAVLVRNGKIIGRGWHRRAGGPHAEVEALRDAQLGGHPTRGATLYVTLEPCCTHGRTPPCTKAILAAGLRRVVVGATDPNPKHAGRAFPILKRAGIEVTQAGSSNAFPGRIANACTDLNESFNHWILHRTPFVTVKAALTLDGKIATADGQSQWITGEKSRAQGMKLRRNSDAILVGIQTILKDDPSLTVRSPKAVTGSGKPSLRLRRIILDSGARTPLDSKIVSDAAAGATMIVVSRSAPRKRVAALAKKVRVLVAPATLSAGSNQRPTLDLRWLLKKLGSENVTRLLVEGGGEVNASFLLGGFAQRVAFFYAPKILGGQASRRGVAGDGAKNLSECVPLRNIRWRRLGEDLLLTARVDNPKPVSGF